LSGSETKSVDLKTVEASQREHYDKIGSDYDTHYSDRWSLAYRDEFLCAPMFVGVDLQGKSVLDALCGGGQLAEYLLGRGAKVWGLDISPVQIASLQERCEGVTPAVGSVFEMPFEDETFDVVGICNALHHLHPHIDEAIKEIHRVLKPGGCFGFSEPAAGTLPDHLRQIWYRFDPLFEESEAAVDIESLKSSCAELFEFRYETYVGNVAYIAVLNSMILRLPASWKDWYSPWLMRVERVLNRLLPRFFSCAVVCSWHKRGVVFDS
jgi:ubiquinone/menaquinone biosynthesis C-methylase UbiE